MNKTYSAFFFKKTTKASVEQKNSIQMFSAQLSG